MPGGAEEAWKVIEQQQRNADAKVEQAKLELARGLSEQQRLIQQRSQWFGKMETAIESFKMQHLNDSVSHYYEILTKAAPTNWDYLIAAGRFEEDYMADYNRAMNYQLSALNTTDNDTYKATSYIIIGGIYEKLDDYSKALDYFKKSLKIVLSVYGENHSQVSSIYDHIGEIYFAQKDYSKALYYFEESLKIRLSLFGENHPEVALSYYSIGSLYIIQGDKSKALNYYEKSLKIRLSVYGENHPLTKEIMDLINVANSKVLQSPETTK